MLDLAKSFCLIFIYLLVFLSLGSLILRLFKEKFSFSLSVLSGFFFYHFLFNLVALPCILTQQTLTALIYLWLPVLCAVLVLAVWQSRRLIFAGAKNAAPTIKDQFKKPRALILPALAVIAVLIVLYLSISSYYMGWDTAFYVRTVLHAVENDSMYTLDAATGRTAATLSLRYALSPFYMNSAVFSRLAGLHPLLVQNLVDGSICVLLAFTVIYRIGLFLFHGDKQKTYAAIVLAALLHICHVSLFSSSEFLILRSYEAKAYCGNIILPFIAYMLMRLWKSPENRPNWLLLFLGTTASNAVSMSSMLTVPLLVAACSIIWAVSRNWRALRNSLICMIPNLLYIGVYFLAHIGVLVIPIA